MGLPGFLLYKGVSVTFLSGGMGAPGFVLLHLGECNLSQWWLVFCTWDRVRHWADSPAGAIILVAVVSFLVEPRCYANWNPYSRGFSVISKWDGEFGSA